MADKALYIGIDATSKSVPLKAIDEGDGSYALKVTTTSGGGATGGIRDTANAILFDTVGNTIYDTAGN